MMIRSVPLAGTQTYLDRHISEKRYKSVLDDEYGKLISTEEKLLRILDYCANNPHIKSEFYKSLDKQWIEKSWLSDRQREALDRAIKRYGLL